MKVTYSSTDKFILSSSCKVVKGAKRSVLIDYLRTDVRVISNDYADLVSMLDRKTISFVRDLIDEKSIGKFDDFLDFMIMNEFGFISDDLSLFPKISDDLNDDHIALIDAIVEVDEAKIVQADFEGLIAKIDALNCANLQLRILSKTTKKFVERVMNYVQKTSIPYVEMYIKEDGISDQEIYKNLILENPTLSNIYVHSSDNDETVPVNLQSGGQISLLMGCVHFIQEPFSRSCCGVINFKNLSFMDVNVHNMTRQFNGCLYKKLTIDVEGKIKNCPSMKNHFGHHNFRELASVISDPKFKALGLIKKDDIKICQDCEFRYNCTDCRAFVSDESDIYSKPLKCGYNPYTNVWQEWSTNPLRKYNKVSA